MGWFGGQEGAIYEIKLKWEKHDATVIWGEGPLCVVLSGLALRRNGVPHMLGSPSPEWENSHRPMLVWCGGVNSHP